MLHLDRGLYLSLLQPATCGNSPDTSDDKTNIRERRDL